MNNECFSKSRKCERLNLMIKTHFNNYCGTQKTIEKIEQMKEFSEIKFRDYMLFDTTKSRSTPKRIRTRREKIFDLLRIIVNGSVSLEAMAKFDARLKTITDI